MGCFWVNWLEGGVDKAGVPGSCCTACTWGGAGTHEHMPWAVTHPSIEPLDRFCCRVACVAASFGEPVLPETLGLPAPQAAPAPAARQPAEPAPETAALPLEGQPAQQQQQQQQHVEQQQEQQQQQQQQRPQPPQQQPPQPQQGFATSHFGDVPPAAPPTKQLSPADDYEALIAAAITAGSRAAAGLHEAASQQAGSADQAGSGSAAPMEVDTAAAGAAPARLASTQAQLAQPAPGLDGRPFANEQQQQHELCVEGPVSTEAARDDDGADEMLRLRIQ